MNVTTTQLDPRIAAIHYKDYRKKVRQHRKERMEAARVAVHAAGKSLRSARSTKTLIEKEDEILMLSYREMVRGQRILNLVQVFRETGIDRTPGRRLPILAIAVANWPKVHLLQEHNQITFSKSQWTDWEYNKRKYRDGSIGLTDSIFPAELTNTAWRKTNNLPSVESQTALVPAIPVHLRPAGDLSEYHILFEANWESKAPPDPLLLRHVAGTIYSVCAQWDLTPVERMVLEGRVSS